MSECKKHGVFLVTSYHYQMGNFELHVETAGVDPSANEWSWQIWRSQPFDQVKHSSEVEGLPGHVTGYLTLAQAKKSGLEHLRMAVEGEMVECKCCGGHGRVLKHKPKGRPCRYCKQKLVDGKCFTPGCRKGDKDRS